MGIKKYNNKYRAAISINGVDTQTYFDTEQQAQAYLLSTNESNTLKGDVWSIKNKKRANAKHQDLPIGWCDYIEKRTSKNGGYTYSNILSSTFMHDKKPIATRINYTKKYTRAAAILMLKARTLKKFNALKTIHKPELCGDKEKSSQ